MYCEKCGSYVEGDSKFCPVCGAAVNAAASQDAAANPDSPANPALQDECMKCLYKHFRHEKLVWMTCGIVLYHCGPYKYRGCYYSTRGGKIKG